MAVADAHPATLLPEPSEITCCASLRIVTPLGCLIERRRRCCARSSPDIAQGHGAEIVSRCDVLIGTGAL
jgi:hypothetical protein